MLSKTMFYAFLISLQKKSKFKTKYILKICLKNVEKMLFNLASTEQKVILNFQTYILRIKN